MCILKKEHKHKAVAKARTEKQITKSFFWLRLTITFLKRLTKITTHEYQREMEHGLSNGASFICRLQTASELFEVKDDGDFLRKASLNAPCWTYLGPPPNVMMVSWGGVPKWDIHHPIN